MKALLIGLGHPRTGTTSLHALLDMQQFCTITHESFIKLPWVPCDQYFGFTRVHVSRYPGAIVGEVAFYFVNYVLKWAKDPVIKFVCMKRSKEPTMASLQRMFDTFNTNHLIDVTSKHWNPDWTLTSQESLLYRPTFPKYDLCPEDALSQYYDDYYSTVALYEKQLPSTHFRVFDMEKTFNTREGQEELLEDYLALTNPIYSEGIRVYKDFK
jgi:hypothetical protein